MNKNFVDFRNAPLGLYCRQKFHGQKSTKTLKILGYTVSQICRGAPILISVLVSVSVPISVYW